MTTDKPLGRKAYGRILHLPGSNRTDDDELANTGQARICTLKTRDKFDTVIVQVKLDGSCVGAAKVDGQIVPLLRAGHVATKSPYEQHQLWAYWVREHWLDFDAILGEGEWVAGEWLAQAHSTRYDLEGRDPFVVFDLFVQERQRGLPIRRLPFTQLIERLDDRFRTPPTINIGPPMSVEAAMARVAERLYGEQDEPEGAIWRVERVVRDRLEVDFLAKFVRQGYVPGRLLENDTRQRVWNWRP